MDLTHVQILYLVSAKLVRLLKGPKECIQYFQVHENFILRSIACLKDAHPDNDYKMKRSAYPFREIIS